MRIQCIENDMIKWRGGPDPPLALPLPPCNSKIWYWCFRRYLEICPKSWNHWTHGSHPHGFHRFLSSHLSESASSPGRIVLTFPAFILFIVSYLTSIHHYPFFTHGHTFNHKPWGQIHGYSILGASAKCCVFFVFAHFIKVMHHTQCAIAIEVLPSRHGRWQHARNMASYIRIYNVMYDGILKATIMIWNFCFEQIMCNIQNNYSLKNGTEIHLARQIHTTCASPGKASGTDIGNMREIWQATLEYAMSCTMGSWRLRSWYEISVSNKICMI